LARGDLDGVIGKKLFDFMIMLDFGEIIGGKTDLYLNLLIFFGGVRCLVEKCWEALR
jgi:hypothetical protein